MKYLLIFIAFFLIFPHAVSAASISSYASGGTCGANTRGVNDGVFVNEGTNSCTMSYSGYSIASNQTLDSIALAKWSTGDYNGLYWEGNGVTDLASFWAGNCYGAGSPSNRTLSGNDLIYFSISNLNATHTWRLNSCYGASWSLDAMEEIVTYHQTPGGINVTAVASPSAGFTIIAISGDTHVSLPQPANTCSFNVYEHALSTNAIVSGFPAATIKLDTSNTATSTINLGSQTYEGYGYTTSSSQWWASGISVPFYPNTNTDVYLSGSCFDASGNLVWQAQGGDSTQPNFDPSLIATPSAMTNTTQTLQPDCGSNVLCYAITWFQGFMSYLFGVSPASQNEIANFKNTLLTRIPFGYVNAALNINLSTYIASTTAVPLFPFNFPSFTTPAALGHQITVTIPPENLVNDSNGNIRSALANFRPLEIIVLWILFVADLIYEIPRRLFGSS